MMSKLEKIDDTLKLSISNIEIYGTYDVIVVGGGIAGVGAAVAAGKRGYKTLIIETTSALGGLVTMGLVNIPLGSICGIGKEMLEELNQMKAHWHRNTDPEKHKLQLDRMVKRHHCDVLFMTCVVDAIVENNVIRGVVIATKTGHKVVYGKRIIDCSGDSDAAYYAGAQTVCGRPGDNMSQAASLDFILGGVDLDAYKASDFRKKDAKWEAALKKGLETGELPYEIENHRDWMTHLPGRPQHCGVDEVSICLAHSRNCFPIDNDDLSRMYMEGREQADILSKFIKKNIPGFENSFLSYTAPLLGVRESRRVIGDYVLSAEDMAHHRKFDDVICIGRQGFDIHNYEGPGCRKWAELEINGKMEYVICDKTGFSMTTTPPPDGREVVNIKGQTRENAEFESNLYYDIPYRSLVAAKIDNLFMAGRNLSSDVHAQSGVRMILTCLSMGEAAGTAAAMSLYENISPHNVNYRELQRALVCAGGNIGQKYREISSLNDMNNFKDKYYKQQ
jgi:hypothetical protein